jgi:hypothetical protein
LSAVGVSCRDDFDVRALISSRRGALGTLVSELSLAAVMKMDATNKHNFVS